MVFHESLIFSSSCAKRIKEYPKKSPPPIHSHTNYNPNLLQPLFLNKCLLGLKRFFHDHPYHCYHYHNRLHNHLFHGAIPYHSIILYIKSYIKKFQSYLYMWSFILTMMQYPFIHALHIISAHPKHLYVIQSYFIFMDRFYMLYLDYLRLIHLHKTIIL